MEIYLIAKISNNNIILNKVVILVTILSLLKQKVLLKKKIYRLAKIEVGTWVQIITHKINQLLKICINNMILHVSHLKVKNKFIIIIIFSLKIKTKN